MNPLYAVIMAGGVGERFWPMSTQERPKQFLNVFTGEPMLLTTARRVSPDIPGNRMVVVTNKRYVREGARLLKPVTGVRFIGEPVGKNTAPAIAAAAALIERDAPDAVMAVLSADHVITPEPEFRKSLALAADMAVKHGSLVCLGVKPQFPHTGLGYIECGSALVSKGKARAFKVKRFVEKPDLAKAKSYVKNSAFLWNCGIFVWTVKSILEAFEQHMPKLAGQLSRVRKAPAKRLNAALDRFYSETAKESIDYGVLEKASNIATVQCPIQWNDVGSWSAYRDLKRADNTDNILEGCVVDVGSTGTTVLSDTGITATCGLTDLYVIRSRDKVLVIHKDKVPDIRKLIESIKSTGNHAFLER